MALILHAHPGPRGSKTLQRWEEELLMWGFQSLRIERAIEREEKRQANIERFGLDPVEATIALHSRRLSLS